MVLNYLYRDTITKRFCLVRHCGNPVRKMSHCSILSQKRALLFKLEHLLQFLFDGVRKGFEHALDCLLVAGE